MLKRKDQEKKTKKIIISRWVLLTTWLIIIIFPFLIPRSGRLVFDLADIYVYFERGLWFVEQKSPISEYPQIPTMLFGLNHIFSMWLDDLNFQKFVYTAVFSFEMIVVLYLSFETLMDILPPEQKNRAYLAFLPPIIYFTVSRFDIFPAFLCLMALKAARNKRWNFAGFILAVATFTKWYPGLILPGFLFYASKEEGKFQRNMLLIFVLTSSIILISSYLKNGTASLLAPYVFHSSRNMEYIALPQLIKNLFGVMLNDMNIYFLAFFILQISFSFLAPIIKIESIEALNYYCIIVIGSFVLFSRIWSPQWFLWIFLFLIVSANNLIDLVLTISYSIVSYLNFPVLFDILGSTSTPLIISGSFTYLILVIIILRAFKRIEFKKFSFTIK